MGENCIKAHEIHERLSAPFPIEDIEWRVSRAFMNNGSPKAIVVAYLKNRAIMNRLDEVVGPENWENEFKPLHNGVLCGIRIHYSETKSRIKWDGADITNIEPTKGGLSGAMKRAAVEWGIGRYIYQLSEMFVDIHQNSPSPDAIRVFQKAKGKTPEIKGFFKPPSLPSWALPTSNKTQERDKQPPAQQESPDSSKNNNQLRQLQNFLNKMEPNLGLNAEPGFMVRIFNKVNPKKEIQLPQEIRKASYGEQLNYYNVLRPVYDLITIGQSYHCDVKTILNYVNQLGHDNQYNGIFHLFFNLSKEDVKSVLNKIKADFQSTGQTA